MYNATVVASGVIGSIAVAQLLLSKGANRYNLSGSAGCDVNDRDRAMVLRGGGDVLQGVQEGFYP